MAKEYLRRAEAAQYLKDQYGIGATRTLAKLASVGGGPVYTKLGAIVLYRPSDLDEWARSRMRRHLSTSVSEASSQAALRGGCKHATTADAVEPL